MSDIAPATLCYSYRCPTPTGWCKSTASSLLIHHGTTERCQMIAPTIWYDSQPTEDYPYHLEAQSLVCNMPPPLTPGQEAVGEDCELFGIEPVADQMVSIYYDQQAPLDCLTYYVGLGEDQVPGPQQSQSWFQERLSWRHLPIQTREDGSYYLELPARTIEALDQAEAALPVAVPLTDCPLPRRLMIAPWMTEEQIPAGYQLSFSHDAEEYLSDPVAAGMIDDDYVAASHWETWVRVPDQTDRQSHSSPKVDHQVYSEVGSPQMRIINVKELSARWVSGGAEPLDAPQSSRQSLRDEPLDAPQSSRQSLRAKITLHGDGESLVLPLLTRRVLDSLLVPDCRSGSVKWDRFMVATGATVTLYPGGERDLGLCFPEGSNLAPTTWRLAHEDLCAELMWVLGA